MRKSLVAVVSLVTAATAALATISASDAASGTGAYATWSEAGTGATAAFSGTYFPGIAATRSGGSWQVPTGASAWLSAQTPFGSEYGSSQNLGYLGVSLPLGGTDTVVSMTFDSPPAPGSWGFALGDVDAENITITATSAAGASIDVGTWFRSSFNYCSVSPKPSSCPSGTHTDVPTWNSPVITGSASDTFGAAAWFRPTAAVKTLTFTQARNVAGAPAYQLWIAADIQASPSPTPSASATPTASSSPSATPTTSASATTPADCSTSVTHLVNGSFEEPAIGAKSYKQIKDSLVPGWNTTASDRLIEIWSDGFQGVTAPTGSQFAEINATQASELYQDVESVPGEELTWALYHRARGAGSAGDTMSVNIGAPHAAADSTTAFNDKLSDGWVLHTGTYVVPAGQTITRFGFESGPTASGSKSIGNFLDNIYFTRTECLPAAATVEPSAEPSATPTPTPSASPTTTPTQTPTPSADDQPPTVTPANEPEADEVVTPTQDNPIVVDPNGPTVIDPIAESGADPDSTITAVEEPHHGTVEIVDNQAIYTPDEGFRGKDTIVVFITEPNDHVIKSVIKVETGRDQVPTTPLGLPRTLHPKGRTVLLDHAVLTNAGQFAKATATCVRILRARPAGDIPACEITRSGSTVSVKLAGRVPMGVRVTVSAPAKGRFGPYLEVRDYLVRPKG